jgi:hypothetical protein
MKLVGDSSLHFISLRMTDTCVFEDGVDGGTASIHPILLFKSLNACHSERSEEFPTFSRSAVKIIGYFIKNLNIKINLAMLN